MADRQPDGQRQAKRGRNSHNGPRGGRGRGRGAPRDRHGERVWDKHAGNERRSSYQSTEQHSSGHRVHAAPGRRAGDFGDQRSTSGRGRGSGRGRDDRYTHWHSREISGPSQPRILGYRKLEQLKSREAGDIALELLKYKASFEALVSSDEIREDWVTLLVVNIGKMCATRMEENLIQALSVLRNSAFLQKHLPEYILQLQFSQEDFEREDLNEVIQCLVAFFKEWLTRFPQASYEIPLDKFGGVLKYLTVDNVEEVRREVETLMAERTRMMLQERKQAQKPKAKVNPNEPPPPDDFRKLPIFPRSEEILSDEPPFLRKNRTEGVYKDLQDYLDVQFRLLREDFVAPLRKGIQEIIKKTPRNERSEDLYIYENVRILNATCTRSGIVHRLALDRQQVKGIPWEHSRRLLYGSLLCFSSDNFKTMQFATVANRKAEDLKKGNVDVRFGIDDDASAIRRVSQSRGHLVMVESPAYFESYSHVLKRLQSFKPDSFPFQRYLVTCSRDVKPPLYLKKQKSSDKPVSYDLEQVLGGVRQVNLLKRDSWAQVEQRQKTLNQSQLNALKAALTQEFAVVQGPPGTGKTYVGLKIVRALLDNRDVWDPDHKSPMLMVCYTNHALDQFLEGVLAFQQTGVIRVGSRSSSDVLEEHNLSKLLTRSDNHRLLADMQACQESWERIQSALESSSRRILSLKEIERVATKPQVQQFKSIAHSCASGDVSVVEEWLGLRGGESVQRNDPGQPDDQVHEMESETLEEEESIDVDQEADIIEKQRSVGFREFEPVQSFPQPAHRERESKRRTILSDSQLRILSGHTNTRPLPLSQANRVQDIWSLSHGDRWRLYLFWLRVHQACYRENLSKKTQEYENICKRWAEFRKNEEHKVLRDAVVIGMTTTGAAKCHWILEQIKPKIVVLEEAAEVLEAHIIATLTKGTQHLILIGDHKQLKPKPQEYELCKTYDLDVSLFERMVKGGMNCQQLNTQHRMRPQIASIMKFIYTGLRDHESVRQYEDIDGVGQNLFFIDHEFHEDNPDTDSRMKSHSNQHEAEFVVSLCEYFLHQGYAPGQITVLTMYTGQLLKLKRLMPRSKFEGVRVAAVDNFQGEENDIILLSLVRSSQSGKIGFLGVENRVCVALSRARQGFYCVGNFRLLAEKSRLWAKIVDHMRRNRALGDSLKLICRNHPDKEIFARRAEDFKKAPEGGCTSPCESRLACGHACERACHPVDQAHEYTMCRKSCLKEMCALHGTRCEQPCHAGEPCAGCPVMVSKSFPKCGHEQLMPCGMPPGDFACQKPCQASLRCGHSCPGKCSDNCTAMECQVVVTKPFPCGHAEEGPCVKISRKTKCTEPCLARLDCLHPCPGNCSDCRQGRMHVTCQEPCERIRVCQHVCTEPCTKNCPPCHEKCANRCLHSKCTKRCCEPCVPCKEPCARRCAHRKCTRLCGEKCNQPPCDQPCRKTLQCRHPCIGLCGEPCPKRCRICHAEEVKEILFGTEDEPNARFVELQDCKHVVEVSGMDKWMATEASDEDKPADVKLKECPKCKTPIRCSNRYADTVKQKLDDIEAVKNRLRQEERKMEATVKSLEKKVGEIARNYPEICNAVGDDMAEECQFEVESPYRRSVRHYFRPVIRFEPGSAYSTLRQWLGQRKTAAELTTIQNQVELLQQVCKVRKKVKADLKFTLTDNASVQRESKAAREEVNAQLDTLERNLMSYQPSDQELRDISSELVHVGLLIKLRSLQCDMLKPYAQPMTLENAILLDELTAYLSPGRRLSDDEVADIEKSLNQIRQQCGLTSLTPEERVMIVKAMNFSQGHWFKCPNGHVYAIGECGGAMQESNCPECNARIGGKQHRLLAGNQVATEMDGARHGAWSDQNNLDNYDREQLMRLQ